MGNKFSGVQNIKQKAEEIAVKKGTKKNEKIHYIH
jgi:hypothetical protein